VRARWAATLIIALMLSGATQCWLDAQPRATPLAEDALYLSSGETLKRASIGFDGLLADVYWLRTVLYFGEQFTNQRNAGRAFDVRQLSRLKPLLDIVTELDPQHLAAYRFGGFFLLLADATEGINFIERGIRQNPGEWRLYQDLGFAYWQLGKFREAADAYTRGSRVAGAPAWMEPLAALMLVKGGDPATARAMLQRLCEASDDEFVKQICAEQLPAISNHQPATTNH
jgi:tetratricopeptide (TPR) repeat protein